MTDSLPILAVVGGTGALGGGLARRWAARGYPVIIGSRAADKARRQADEINAGGPASPVRGMDNPAAADAADIVVVTVPHANHRPILAAIKDVVAGKLVVDTTVPLVPPKVASAQLPPQGSAAQAAREFLGAEVRVVSAFHNVAAHKLRHDAEIDCDVLVCGDRTADREAVIALVAAAGLRGIHAGPLANSAAAEALTSVLIGINRRYKVDAAGIRITGLEPDPRAGDA